jgi:hypothetical protein
MRRQLIAIACLAVVLACGGASFTPEPPGAFDPSGVKLVIGVERPKTFVVRRDGEVVSSETGNSSMKFVGCELRTIDGTKPLVAVVGDELRSGDKHIGTFEGDALVIGTVRFLVTDDGQVRIERHSETRTMRKHFEGKMVGHRRPALMLVAFVFAMYAASNPHASLESFTE